MAKKTISEACQALKIHHHEEEVRCLVVYEMTDGMRTSTNLTGADAYVDGGLFAMRVVHLLKTFGARSCYVNVIEERHRLRENYPSILDALRRLYPVYREYALDNGVRLRFLGDLEKRLEPLGVEGDFAADLRRLEEETEVHKGFTAFFLINYSLDWAMRNLRRFKGLPKISQIVRHTKFQIPTGMSLPPTLSDYSSCVYVQQGSSSKKWSDIQLICLIAVALRSMVLNRGTQYLKTYSKMETNRVKAERERKAYIWHTNLFAVGNRPVPSPRSSYNVKRAIIAGPLGPEIYEF